MSPSSRIRLGFSTICFYLPMFFDTVSMNSYVPFKWCHGLVCTLLFPSRAHSYICSFFRANMSPSSRIWLGFSPICFIGPCFSILFVLLWLFHMGPWVGLLSVISQSCSLVLLFLFRAKMSPSSRIGLGVFPDLFYRPMFYDCVSMCSYFSFKWWHGLLCNMLFPSRAHLYV